MASAGTLSATFVCYGSWLFSNSGSRFRLSSSDLGPHIITPLRKKAAVHHSKNCAMMSQVGRYFRSLNNLFLRCATFCAVECEAHKPRSQLLIGGRAVAMIFADVPGVAYMPKPWQCSTF
jgi:hypothetical protein